MLVRLSHSQWAEMTERMKYTRKSQLTIIIIQQVMTTYLSSLLDLHNKMHDHLLYIALYIAVYFMNTKSRGYKKKMT